MSTPGLFIGALEIALNRFLRLEPEVLAECASLRGRSIAVALAPLGWQFCIEFVERGVQVREAPRQRASVTVSGSLGQFLRLAQAVQGDGGLPQGLEVHGEVDLLTRFQKMLSRVGFDPEELLAQFMPGPSAHRLNQLIGSVLSFGQQAARDFSSQTAAYLRDQSNDLVHREQIDDWTQQVEQLRDGTDRLEARLRRLEARWPVAR